MLRKKRPQAITSQIIFGEYFTCIKKSTTSVALVTAMVKAMIGFPTPKFWKAAQTVKPVNINRISQIAI